ncbi:MAG: CopD family protein [Thioalkalispiraceae bacterium]|jgi:uncharacterized membrane protein
MTINTFNIVLHLLSAVVWVGGMFFAYMCLRPVAASQLEPPQRLTLWVGVFQKFFPFVWLCVIFLPLTGYLMTFSIWGGFADAPKYIHIMNGLGIIMILIYMHVFFAPFKRLKNAVAIQDWPTGGKNLNQIRKMVGINTSIGLIVILVASGGRFFG